jgi:hypothetical protein
MSETKNNHYVSQFYIAKWKINDNKQIWCLKKDESKIFKPKTDAILFGKKIWNYEVEKAFAEIESEWACIINKILEDKTTDKLSESQLNSFLSFIFALKMRKKENITEYRKALDCANAEFDNKYTKGGKVLEEIVEMQKYDDFIFDCLLLLAFSALTPNKIPLLIKKSKDGKDGYIYEYFRFFAFPSSNLKKLFGPLIQFKRFSFGVKIIQEEDIKYGQFLTSDSPLLVKRPGSRQIIGAHLMIALAPNLLVFGAKEYATFIALNNKPINIFIEEFNKDLYNNSEYIISNKKPLLEQFM